MVLHSLEKRCRSLRRGDGFEIFGRESGRTGGADAVVCTPPVGLEYGRRRGVDDASQAYIAETSSEWEVVLQCAENVVLKYCAFGYLDFLHCGSYFDEKSASSRVWHGAMSGRHVCRQTTDFLVNRAH